MIRHGEARRDGRADHGLTANGARQALELAAVLEATGVLDGAVALVSSPLLRAQQTAGAMAAICDLRILTEPDLCEMGDAPSIGEDEAFSAFLGRVELELTHLASEYRNETVVVVTHAGFIVGSVLTRFAVPIGTKRAWLEPANGSVTEWHWDGDVWSLATYNSFPSVRP